MITYVKFYCQRSPLFQMVSTFSFVLKLTNVTSTKYVNLLLLRGNVKEEVLLLCTKLFIYRHFGTMYIEKHVKY